MQRDSITKALATLGLAVICAVPAVGFDGAHQKAEAADNRPDVIFIMDDDRGRVGGNKLINAHPNLRKHYNQSMVLQSTDSVPLCGPSRAGILTGLYPGQHGINNNNGYGLNMNRTFLKAAKDSGVYVTVAGKLINNPNHAKIKSVTNRTNLFYSSHEGGGAKLKNKAVDHIRTAPLDKPGLFIALPTAPHSQTGSHLPYVEKKYRGIARCQGIGVHKPPTYNGRYNPAYPFNMPRGVKGGWPLKKICEAMTPTAELLAAMEAEQAKRNRPAIIIYMPDNGMALGARNHASKANPWSMWNDITVRGSGIKPGKVSVHNLISTIDVGVTIADIFGASMPWAKGRSFLPLLKGQKYARRSALNECFPHPKPSISFVARRFNYKGEIYRVVRYGNGRTFLTIPSKQPYEWTNFKDKRPAWLTKNHRKAAKNWAWGNCRGAL